MNRSIGKALLGMLIGLILFSIYQNSPREVRFVFVEDPFATSVNGENCDSFLGVFHPHIKKKKVTNKMFLLGLFFRDLLSQRGSSCAEPVLRQARAKALILYKNSADIICYGPFHGYYKNGDYFNNDHFKVLLVKEVWNDDWSIIEKMD